VAANGLIGRNLSVCLPGRSHALKSVTMLGRATGTFEKALATKPLTQEMHRQ
jgi:hypothetical protein